MDNHQDILDLTIRMMQRASIHLMRLSEELLVPGKVLSEVELVDLKFRIEVIADGLDKDSLSCQAALDDVNKATDDGNLSELIPSDAIVGVNQSSGGYYKRMHEFFETHKPLGSNRSQLAIKGRWGVIQNALNRFSGFKSIIDRRNESGKNEQDSVPYPQVF